MKIYINNNLNALILYDNINSKTADKLHILAMEASSNINDKIQGNKFI